MEGEGSVSVTSDIEHKYSWGCPPGGGEPSGKPPTCLPHNGVPGFCADGGHSKCGGVTVGGSNRISYVCCDGGNLTRPAEEGVCPSGGVSYDRAVKICTDAGVDMCTREQVEFSVGAIGGACGGTGTMI